MLLDGGPDAVDVYAEVAAEDDDGNPVRRRSQTPVTTIHTRLHELSSAETADRGIVDTAYFFRTRLFPAGAWGEVFTRGRWWKVTGEPGRANGSPMTSHSHIILTALEPEALP